MTLISFECGNSTFVTHGSSRRSSIATCQTGMEEERDDLPSDLLTLTVNFRPHGWKLRRLHGNLLKLQQVDPSAERVLDRTRQV